LRPLIQQLLDEWCKKRRKNFRLKVVNQIVNQVVRKTRYTYYTIMPDRKGVRSFEYVSVLGKIEKVILQERHGENVMLLSAEFGEDDIVTD